MIKLSPHIMIILLTIFVISCGGDSTTLLNTDNGSNGDGNTAFSGKVVDYYGDGIQGVRVSLNGSAAETDSTGEYNFKDMQNGSYNLIMSKEGYTFLPESRDITADSANVSVKDFIGLTGTFAGGHNGDNGYCAQCH